MINFETPLTLLLKKIQLRIDTTSYFVDRPRFDYQPIPWIGIKSADIRGKATKQRWLAIKHHFLTKDMSMKDVGCCVGYFCISASVELKMYSYGVDSNIKFLRIANNSMPDIVVGKCSFINLTVDESNVETLPNTDVTLCLSIWHHWVYYYGLSKATRILVALWQTTGRMMVFESGEEEVKKEFGLPYPEGVSAEKWLEEYLISNLKGAVVTKIGKYYAGKYPHYLIKNKKRTLFKIYRPNNGNPKGD